MTRREKARLASRLVYANGYEAGMIEAWLHVMATCRAAIRAHKRQQLKLDRQGMNNMGREAK